MNAYLYPSELGRVNSWEYFFKQPGTISLDEALSCKRYIIGKDDILHVFPRISAAAFYNKDGKLDYWRSICRKYIRFSQPVLDRLEQLTRKAQGRKILGVLVRGTDYVALRPYGHPVQPTAEQAIAKAQEVMSTGNYEAVYLATEDKNIAAKFQEAFGDDFLLPECDYIDYDYDHPEYLLYCSTERENDKSLRGLEYLVSMIFLSRCPGLITSLTSGSTGVMCLSEGFEYLYVFDLGVYPKKPVHI